MLPKSPAYYKLSQTLLCLSNQLSLQFMWGKDCPRRNLVSMMNGENEFQNFGVNTSLVYKIWYLPYLCWCVGSIANENIEFTSCLSASVSSRYKLIQQLNMGKNHAECLKSYWLLIKFWAWSFQELWHTNVNYWVTYNLCINRLKFVIFNHSKDTSWLPKFLKLILIRFHWK